MGLNRNLGNLTEVIKESGGKIGIGTGVTAPVRELEVKGSVQLSNPTGSFILYGYGATNDFGLGTDTGQATRDFNLYNYNTASINLSVNRANGNIGIGEAGPTNKLSVLGPSLGNMIKWTDNQNNTGYLGIRNLGVSISSDDDLIFETGGTSKIRLFKNGNVFVGTSPVDNGNKFRVNGIISSGTSTSVQGQITLFSTTAAAEGNIYGRTGGGLMFNTNSNAYPIEFYGSFVRFNPKVGIGWSNPAYNLQVLGNCAIGMNTNGTATIEAFNGTAFFGNGGTSTCLGIYNNGNYYFTGSNVSDIRAKNNIQDLEINSLQKVLELKPKSYNMNNNPDKIRYGFIAQDVYKIIPELIDGDIEGEDFIGIDYNGIIPILVGAIKELKAEIEILKSNK
jgi:hypothetical protein